MKIEELVEKDNNFSVSSFISKVDNTYIMLKSAIMTGNIKKVKHKISPDIYKNLEIKINELNEKNQQQLYDELNIKSTQICEISEDTDNYIIKVLLISRFMNYIIDKESKKYISGNKENRIEKKNYLTFKKHKNSKKEKIVKKCPGCGANLNVSSSGICTYCGATYDTENYDWVLTNIN